MSVGRDDMPPNSEDAEKAHLGSRLLLADRPDDPAWRVEPHEYYGHRHRLIAEAIDAVHDAGAKADAVTVGDALGDKLDEAGGHAYLLELLQSAPHVHHGPHYAAIVKDDAERRKVIDAAAAADRAARDRDTPLDELQDRLAPILNRGRRSNRVAVARRLSCFPSQQIEWVWPGRFPLGKLTMLLGDPGLGKSFLTTDAAARVTVGAPWPDCPLEPQPVGSVILFNAEDDPSDTIRPRLEQAGGDPEKVIIVEGVADAARRGERPKHFSIAADLAALDKLVGECGDVRLIVIDPVSAYCGGMDGHKNTEVRAALAPLSDLAARHRVAVVAVSHLNKAGGSKAIYRASGSLAFIAAARIGWLVAKDKDDPERRVMVPVKANITAEPTGLAFKVISGQVAWEPEPFKLHGDDVLADEVADRDESNARSEAEAWLRDYLADGQAVAGDVLKAARSAGLSDKAVRTARERICDRPFKEGFGREGHWYWRLRDQAEQTCPPKDAPKGALDAPSPRRGALGIFDGDGGTLEEGADQWWK